MKSRKIALAAVLCLLGTMLAVASPAAAASGKAPKAQRSAGSLLFVQETQGGELERVRSGVYRLVFRGVSPSVATFTDRPRRRAGDQGLTHFVHGWAGDGFASDPPNAALVLHGAPSSRDVAMLTLSHPRYDRRAQRLTYTAKPLHGSAAKSLAGLSRRGDPLAPLSFGAASLFIDDAGSETAIQPIFLKVTSTEPGPVSLVIPNQDPPVYWSLGRPGERGGGLRVSGTSGPVVELSDLTVTPTELTFMTGGEPGFDVFTISLFLEAEAGAETFSLIEQSNPGNQIEISLNGVQEMTSNGLNLFPLFGG